MYPYANRNRRNAFRRWSLVLSLAFTVLGTASCERSYWDPTVKVGDPKGHILNPDQSERRDAIMGRGGAAAESIALGDQDSKSMKGRDSLQRGTGSFVRKVARPKVDTSPGDVTLNFDGTDVREVVKVMLGDLLKVNYVLHPSVQGVVSLQTGRPLRREDLIPTLETILRMNNAAVVYRDGTYEVLPVTNAMQGKLAPQLGDTNKPLPAGYSVQVVPLRYIGADEMSNILKPLAPEGSVVRVDNLRNLIIIAGTSPEMSNLLDTVRIFDVDWMSGLSVGFFILEYAKAKDIVTQLEGLLAEEGSNPLKGVFRFVPVENTNAVLVVSPQEDYIQQARNWIERLDMAAAAGGADVNLFVYRVKHSDAQSLAQTLSALYGGTASGSSKSVGSVAPGLGRSKIGSGTADTATSASRDTDAQSSGLGSGQTQGSQNSTSTEIELSSRVNIVADVTNNSLLIRSNPRDYRKILDALKQLDILPLQVLVEATIAEITLSGSLKYGVQWQLFGTSSNGKSYASLDGALDGGTGISTFTQGFNWAVVSNPSTIKATLSALASESLVNVLSSPSVMVMDNGEAEIKVTQQVPILTAQQQATTTNSNVVNSIEYKEAGVILKVKPRVTPGGLVQLMIDQEVSTVEKTSSSTLNTPTFQKRNITSSVAVRSNQAVVLGGLIQDTRSNQKGGVPGLFNLPYAGALFGERDKESKRTELVVVLTPKVVASDQDVEAVAEDFRNKVRGLNVKF